MRRVTVSSFRGQTMVNLREYYEKDGQELPGKKVGDSLEYSRSEGPWLLNTIYLHRESQCPWLNLQP